MQPLKVGRAAILDVQLTLRAERFRDLATGDVNKGCSVPFHTRTLP